MSDETKRLIQCFASVFPTLTPEEIPTVSIESTGVWDSLATVTLAAVVTEEFDIKIDQSEMSNLDSFQAFKTYLLRNKPAMDVM